MAVSRYFYVGFFPLLLLPIYIKYYPESPAQLIAKKHITELKNCMKRSRPDAVIPDDTTFVVNQKPPKSPVSALFTENRTRSTIGIWLSFFFNICLYYGVQTWLPKMMMDAGFALDRACGFYSLSIWDH
jgi:AAHS family benzoate transporter-like MFS transporter